MISGIKLINKYFSQLTSHQRQQFEKLLPLYKEWNEKINVISRKDIDHLYERHVLHSLGIAKVISFPESTSVVDAGTGGGFPGIPLAIYFPAVHFHLVDSIGKKIKVVNEVVSALELKNVTTQQARITSVVGKGGGALIPPSGGGGAFDFVVSRAVASLKEMVDWSKPLLNKGNKSTLPNGMIFLKGGELKKEIEELKQSVKIFSISDFFEEDFFKEKRIIFLKV